MFGLGIPELLLVLVVVLVFFGGSKLPAIGKGLGESIRSFRRALKEGQAEASDDASDKDARPR